MRGGMRLLLVGVGVSMCRGVSSLRASAFSLSLQVCVAWVISHLVCLRILMEGLERSLEGFGWIAWVSDSERTLRQLGTTSKRYGPQAADGLAIHRTHLLPRRITASACLVCACSTADASLGRMREARRAGHGKPAGCFG